MNLDEIKQLLKGESKYRYQQVWSALFRDLISSWDEAKNLPKDLRNKLELACPLEIKVKIFSSENSDTIKSLLTLSDGLKIESVLLRHQDGRNTICVSCQVGCPLGCLFCATGQLGYKRNLTAEEIIEQVLFFARYLKTLDGKVTNIVFMGMGEPFLNYDNVVKAIKVLNDAGGFNLGARNFSISTVGIIEGIKKLTQEKLQINLAISLHSADEQLRTELMPINKKYPLRKVLAAVDEYIRKTNRKVMFEYLMIKDINDSPVLAEKLATLVRGKPLYLINLILYNTTGRYKSSDPNKVKEFAAILRKNKVAVTIRHRFGRDINAACGQLAVKNK